MCIVSVLWYCISHVSILLFLGCFCFSLYQISSPSPFHLRCEIVLKQRNCAGP
ncbi:hypothetical protein HanIR_Chr15g0767741 [Helianthus annuus]|nr:hypothetical protein HanIR_Chr15g0767741 [Helianthus annuus]